MSERRIRAADDVDAIYTHIQRVKAEKAKELQAADHDAVAQRMSESAKPAYIDYCGFTMPDQAFEQERLRKIEAYKAMSAESAAWQAEWAKQCELYRLYASAL